MENDKKESIWESLVDELGVEVNPEAVERKQPAPVDLPSASHADEHETHLPERPKSTAKDWNALAELLGIEVPPEEEAEPVFTEVIAEIDEIEIDEDDEAQAEDVQFDELPSSTTEADLSDDEFSDVEENSDEADFEDAEAEEEEEDNIGISGEAARDAFEALFADTGSDWELPQADPSIFDTPLEFKTEIDEEGGSETEDALEAQDAEESSDEDEEEALQRPKRRRRRRRGRRGRGEEKAEDAEEQESDELDDSLTEEGDEEEDAEIERPKRRRRRRSKRGSKAGTGASDDADAEESADDDSEDFDESDEEDKLTASENGSRGARRRAAHRNLPTWSEAIGCIVDGNLEQRSKAPAKQSPRGRGRGRGRRKN